MCTLACMLKETGMVDPGTGQALQDRYQLNNVWLLLETTSSFVHELFPDYKDQDMAQNFFYKARALAEACLLVKVGEGSMDKCEVANLYYQTVRGKDYSVQFMTVQNVWKAARSSFNAEIERKKQEA
ncbi:uncharacterized protein LOC111058483, partial [Nilaparvata lugens]|uniref:uncharacterized protein LOC111058483 n=1 Tax=Nilaparvata lugens TaxID=108931 RepID=UPI00193EA21A